MSIDPIEPIPEEVMKFLRPIGQVLAALFIGFNGTYVLIAVLAMAGGPDLMESALSLCLSATLLTLFWIVRRSRRKRADAARRPVSTVQKRRQARKT